MSNSFNEKQCKTCSVIKSIADFSYIKSRNTTVATCKSCIRVKALNRASSIHVDNKKCGHCTEIKGRTFFDKNKWTTDGLANKCKSCRLVEYKETLTERQAYLAKEETKKLRRAGSRSWYKRNKKRVAPLYLEKRRNKYNSDFNYKFSTNLRNYLSRSIKGRGLIKNSKFYEYLGCDIKTLKEHLESKFKPGMSWDNYGEWHVDHKRPIKSVSTDDDLRIVSHYSNLQPLWAFENLSKGSKYD